MRKLVIVATVLAAFSLAGLMIPPDYDYSSYAQSTEEASETQFYGCGVHPPYFEADSLEIHCDPLLNEIKSYLLTGTSTLIYDPAKFAAKPPNIRSYSYSGMMVSMVFAPDGRLFFTEKNTGNIRIMHNDKVLETPFVHISKTVKHGEHGMLGLALDPDFENNHFVYLYYTYEDNATKKPFNRVVRFIDDNSAGRDMRVLLDRIPASCEYHFHAGGALAFGPDERLYITVGDDCAAERAQMTSSLSGKVLRINRDGTIPADNPFPDSPVYTIGHRNMFGIAFDKDGTGIVTENGPEYYDEINKIEKGGNYGWKTQQRPNKPPEFSVSSVKPLRSYWKAISPAQAIYYDGDKIPELKGKFLFAAYLPGNIYALELERDGTKIIQEEVVMLDHDVPVVTLAQSPDGSIYYGAGAIYRIEKVDATDKKQILFPVEIAGPADVRDLDLEDKEMVIEMDVKASPSTIAVKIPNILLGGAYQVLKDDGIPAIITVDDSSPDHTIVNARVPVKGDMELVIVGSTMIPEFPLSGIVLIFTILSLMVGMILLQRRQLI